MKQTGDLTLIKKMNKTLVLEIIRQESPISRAAIAESTGLTKATVSSLVAELIEEKLAEEIGMGASRGGRKPMLLLFGGTAGYAVGIDLSVGEIHAALADFNGRIVKETRLPFTTNAPEAVIAALTGCIRSLIEQASPSPYGVVGIGVGIPGLSDEDGNVLFAPNLGWENVPLRKRLEETFGVPVVIDNEANMGAVGVKATMAEQDTASLVYVSIGAGIGTGLIIDNGLYRGVSGFAGEMGHVSIQLDGKPCRCGNSGCWELYASEQALLEEARKTLGDPDIQLAVLLERARKQEPAVRELFRRQGSYLGVGIVNIVNVFNPQHIVIGGGLSAAAEWLEPSLQEVVERRSQPYPRTNLTIQFSKPSTRPTLVGACSAVVTAFLAGVK